MQIASFWRGKSGPNRITYMIRGGAYVGKLGISGGKLRLHRWDKPHEGKGMKLSSDQVATQ